MATIKKFVELTTPDERSLRFTPLGLNSGGTLTPEYAAEFQQQSVANCDLHSDVAADTRNGFERLRTLHSYGILCYEAFTVADDLAWLVMEQAYRERFLAFFGGDVPMFNAKTGEERPITGDSFESIYQAFRRGGSHARGDWRLKLTTGETMRFRATLSQLQDWARREHLLDGQRNKRLDPVFVAMRNAVAHHHYHLAMPPDSARTIRDLAEIINRLWGYKTPGGRLYPAPLQQEVLTVAWSNSEAGHMQQMRADQLAGFNEPGDWTCLVIRGVADNDEFWDFDAQFERTTFPSDLLFGPETLEVALAWLKTQQPTAKPVEYLDRLFVLRIHDGRVSLPRRPEVALSVPPERRDGRWLAIRADFPNDAFAHVRHIKNGVTCGDPDPGCAVEDVIDGVWQYLVDELEMRFNITESAELRVVRVPPRWGVASDVEAE